MGRLVHHLALAADWSRAIEDGSYRISTRGRTLEQEGFIHACFLDQIDGVAGRYYRDVTEALVLLAVDVTRFVGEVRLEVPPGAPDAFPHLYGPILPAAVVAVTPYEPPPVDAAPARVHHPHLFASNVAATVGFYRRWFGARIVADEVLAGSRNVMLALGDGRLNVYDQPPPAAGRSAVHHLGIQVRGLPSLVERFRAAGVALRKPIRHGEGFAYVMVEGPDGVLLEVFESDDATTLPTTRPWFAWA
jgi:uncharacterized protein (DUF952 family)/catechol 2,3-dioxygenase-like lactoylglutathione lyase family enzyme